MTFISKFCVFQVLLFGSEFVREVPKSMEKASLCQLHPVLVGGQHMKQHAIKGYDQFV